MGSSKDNLYCQYIEKLCPAVKSYYPEGGLFFAYPSQPETSADAIRKAIKLLSAESSLKVPVIDWKELPFEGNLIICEICKAIRKASCTVVNTTYVNFNVLFEYGLAVGSKRAIWPLIETGVSRDELLSSNVKSITTIGYSEFSTGVSIFRKMVKKKPWTRISQFPVPQVLGAEPDRRTTGILYIKSALNNEPSLRISETLSTSPCELIADDPNEVPFHHLTWYLTQIGKAYAVIIHLGSERMVEAHLHWAKCALVAGMALALGRRLLMLGENITFEPIDYRDLLKNYKNSQQAESIVRNFLSTIVPAITHYREYMEHDITMPVPPRGSILETADLGDYVAENELNTLEQYFIETPQFLSALEPKFRVYVGRKGSGKTANYYMLCNRLQEDKRNVVCMIKPREYELNELLQFVKDELDVASKGYLLESLWKFMLYSEALKSIYDRTGNKPPLSISPCEKAINDYFVSSSIRPDESFTSRLVRVVRDLCESFPRSDDTKIVVSEILHSTEIKYMHDMICEYILKNCRRFTILIDGLDANWRLGENYEIMSAIVLALIGSAKDLWRDCSREINRAKKEISILIFVRSDVFRAALERARDPDKLQYELIFWPDVNSLIDLVGRRIVGSQDDQQDEVFNWSELLEPGYTPEDMNKLLANNLLLRPRDFIYYFQRVIYYARLRGTMYLTKRDFNSALSEYSDYALLSLSAEAQPFIPNMLDLLLEFDQGKAILTLKEVHSSLSSAGVQENGFRKAVDYLVNVNFLGYGIDDFNFRFPVSPADETLIIRRSMRYAQRKQGLRRFKIHNAFNKSLNLK